MQVTNEELATLIGVRDIEIYALQRQLQAALKRISELEKKNETPDPAAGTASS